MNLQKILLVALVTLFISCGGEVRKDAKPVVKQEVKKVPIKAKKKQDVGIVDLKNKGIGPVKSVTLAATIDQEMAAKGAKLFKNKCLACHRTNRKFIGPNPTGILNRRSPEWVMNMIMNPGEMVKKDPIAKALLMKFNGSPMANQNLTEAETREILEFFRTLK